MRKILIFNALLITVISCSEDNLDKKDYLIPKNIAELDFTAKKLNLDSIFKMNNGAFLESALTTPEIDSILKMRTFDTNRSTYSSTIAGEEYTDASGYIHLRIFWAQSPTATHFPHAEATISNDYVLVGGGAATTNGQYLFESRPDDQLTKWIASSKDHLTSGLHYVTAYAIGMKIDGVTTEYLRSKIHLYSSTSPQKVNHPDWTVTIPSGVLLLGGGAYDRWNENVPLGYGNMLTASYPISSTQWRARGKDHRRADPSKITAYAIGIEDISYPNVGYLQVSSLYVAEHIPTGGYETTPIAVPSGWGLTCSAGQVTYYGLGRFIIRNFPSSIATSTFESGYNLYPDEGDNYSWALMIQGGI